MKLIQTLNILFLILLVACTSEENKSTQDSFVDTVAKSQFDTEHLTRTGELYEKNQSQIDEERALDISDSINMIRTLDFALKMGNKNINKNEFVFESDTLKIRYGYIFSTYYKHLIISRVFQYGINVDIYKLQKSTLVKVCSKNMAPLAFIGDTIQDVNGDGRIDYLFHWYPMSGCCLRDIYDVFLQKPNGDFAEEVEFVNPNFSPKEKIIRGLCYGHAAPLYKFKWDGYKVDTVEYIYFPDSTNGNQFIRRKHKDETDKGELIRKLPVEYNKIGFGNE